MESTGVARGCRLRDRRLPHGLMRHKRQSDRGDGQRRHVQRLADGASGLLAAGVFVQEYRTRDEVQQRHASYDG
jgi:hypothetical protein